MGPMAVTLLQRGDVLRIGLNRLSFMSGESREEAVFSSVPQKVIQSDLSVVIEGETGTGKSRLPDRFMKSLELVGTLFS